MTRALALILLGCSFEVPGQLPFCDWADVDPMWAPLDGSEAPPDKPCLVVKAPENARVSAVPIAACDAPELGSERVSVRGGPVYRYSKLDLTPGLYAAGWRACGD